MNARPHSAAVIHPELMTVDRASGVPLQRQIYGTLRRLILEGHIPERSCLPSTRELAAQLQVGRNTVVAAYDQLLAEGFVEAKVGAGTRVAALGASRGVANVGGDDAALPALSERGTTLSGTPQPARTDGFLSLHPGRAEVETFPFSAWGALLARNARNRTEALLGYTAYAGHEGLRQTIAKRVCVGRGILCAPEQVIVVTGAQAGLDLLARVLLDPGDVVWMEEPGYRGARGAFLAAGARIFPLHVDRQNGWRLPDPSLPPPRLIYVTPACQWPLGCTMRIEERLQLIETAAAHGAWIVEDDYDGEYRLRGTPVPALHGLDATGRTITVGSFGKTMFSALRIGYLVVPRRLADAFGRALSVSGQFAPLVLQATLDDFIREGLYSRHVKRMRRLYGRRQERFAEVARKRLSPFLELAVSDSGMQILGLVRGKVDDADVTRAAREEGLDVQGNSINYAFSPPRHGLLLGYAALGDEEAVRAVEGLRTAFLRLEG